MWFNWFRKRETVVLRAREGKCGRWYWTARYAHTGELAAISDMPGFESLEACEADMHRLCGAMLVVGND